MGLRLSFTKMHRGKHHDVQRWDIAEGVELEFFY